MKKYTAYSAAAATALLLLCSCGIIAFPDTSGLRFFPEAENEILSPGQDIRVSFPFAPDRESAENILTVRDAAGNLPGIFSWRDNSLVFVPEPPLLPGVRYVFSFSGVFLDRRGREYEHHHLAPFFCVFRNERAPFLISASPPPGGPLGGNGEIRLLFSRDIDTVSFGEGFTLSPRRAWDLSWREGSREAVIRPREGWENLVLYTLSFGGAIKDTAGAVLASCPDILYLVQDDTACPAVLCVGAAANNPEEGFPSLGEGLPGVLAGRDAIRIVFSEAMDRDTTRDAVRLSPDPGGTWFWTDDRVLVFIPETEYEAGTAYTLEIGGSAEDLGGNRLHPWGPLSFTARTAFLDAAVELAGDGIVLAGPDFLHSGQLTVNLPPPFFRDYTFIVDFSGGVFAGDREKLSAMEGFTVSCVFPPAAPSPVPSNWAWTGDRRLTATFSGFSPGTAEKDYYYLLTLRGGPGGIRAGDGAVLRRDLSRLLKTGIP